LVIIISLSAIKAAASAQNPIPPILVEKSAPIICILANESWELIFVPPSASTGINIFLVAKGNPSSPQT